MDILAAIMSEPTSLALWAVFLFAASMWPVGLLWCCCCPTPSESGCTCYPETTPDTITLTVSGLPDCWTSPADAIIISINSDFGGLAAARATAPEFVPGPITGVEVTFGGGGYAVFGRAEPAVTTSVSGGSGGQIVPTISETVDSAGKKAWNISGIAVSQGGTGYADTQEVSFAFEEGAYVAEMPGAIAYGGRVEPTLLADPQGSGGAGAVLSVSTTQSTDSNGRVAWRAASITIEDGGLGYGQYDYISFSASGDGEEIDPAAGVVLEVGEYGEILEAIVGYGGYYFARSGALESVTVYDPGEFYKTDPDEPPEVADIEVVVTQLFDQAPFASGAELSAVVDTDTASPTFGQITAITIDNGGDGYVAVVEEYVSRPSEGINGVGIVLRKYEVLYPPELYPDPVQFPAVAASVESQDGYGACLVVSGVSGYADLLDLIERDAAGASFRVAQVNIVRGGSMYAVGDAVVFSLLKFGTIVTAPQATVTRVSNTGFIEEITISDGGEIYRPHTYRMCEYRAVDCKTHARVYIRKANPDPVFRLQPSQTPVTCSVQAGRTGDEFYLAGPGVESCESFSASLTGEYVMPDGTKVPVSATVESGGTYDEELIRNVYNGNADCRCCWSSNDADQLDEIEVEWYTDINQNADDFEYVGNFFLPRISTTTWRLPGFGLRPSTFLYIDIGPCDNRTNPGCNTCTKKCKTRVFIQTDYALFCNVRTSDHFECQDSCVDAELCTPQPGEYVLDVLGAPVESNCQMVTGKVVVLPP